MGTRDLVSRDLFLALSARLRGAGVEAGTRMAALRRAGNLLALDHAEVDALVRESPQEAGMEAEELYLALFEIAMRRNQFDELDVVLRLGGVQALGVGIVEHGERVAALVEVPQVPPPAERTGDGFGRLERLDDGDQPLLLGADHGPSAVCPACTARIRLLETLEHQETKSGVSSLHPWACQRCRARGTLRRFHSFRLRGNRDSTEVACPGLLGPLASRAWCRRGGLGMLTAWVGFRLAGVDGPGLLLAGLYLVVRSECPPGPWRLLVELSGLVAAVMGLRSEGAGRGFGLALATVVSGSLHALWAVGARPEGWDDPGGAGISP